MNDLSYMEDLLIDLAAIYVSANVDARPDIKGYWSYDIVAYNQASCLQFEEKAEGNVTLCNCSNCCEYEKEILEIFSLCKALNWVKANEPGIFVRVYVKSKLLSYLASNTDYFHHKIENTRSCFLRALRNEFSDLLTVLSVDVVPLEGDSKEIIPTRFEVFETLLSKN